MPVYMVSYDIPEDNQSYKELTKFLKEQLKAKTVLESQWLFNHEGDADKLMVILRTITQKDDLLMVQEVTLNTAFDNTLLSEDEILALFETARE